MDRYSRKEHLALPGGSRRSALSARARRARARVQGWATRALAAALLVAVVLASAAWAHATLVEATPADGAALADAPDAVTLRFDEAVEPIALRVIDASGQVVAAAVPAAGASLSLRLPGLARGSYVVSYRVVSADAHPIGGSLVFAIGAPSASAPPRDLDGAREAAWQSAAIAVRGLRDAALLFAVGGALFVALVLARGDPTAERLTPTLRFGAVIAIALSVAAIGVVGGLVVLAPPSAILDRTSWSAGLATSAAPSAIAIIAGALLATAALPARTTASRALAVLGALLAAAGAALTGHAVTAGPVMQALHAAHVLAAAIWLGALWPLLVLARQGDDAATVRAARRFGALAGPAVAMLVLAGGCAALAYSDDLGTLVASGYGRLVAVKLAALLALLALAAANRWRLVPRLAGRGEQRAFIAALRLDLALGLLVLAATAALVHTPPPHGALPHPGHDGPVHDTLPRDTPLPDAPLPDIAQPRDPDPPRGVVVAISGDRTMIVEIEPGTAGRNTVTLAFSGAGAALAPREVRVELALPGAGIEPIVRAAQPTGDGRFRFAGPELALAGRWSVRVEALIDDFEKTVFSAAVAIR